MAWITVGNASDIPEEGMKLFSVEDVEIAVYHLADGWYATANLCTHQDCSLVEEGEIEDDEIVCLCHGGAFNIRNGSATRMPCVRPLETFDVQISAGKIEIDFE